MREYKLKNVVLHITNICASNCPFCYAHSDGEGRKSADLDILCRIVDELKKAQIEQVSLLGGDPALHPHIMDIAEYVYKQGISAALMSNTFDLPVSLKESSKYFSLYETTIHGSDSETHDKFCRTEGAYDSLMKKLRELTAINAKIGVAINIIQYNTTNRLFDSRNGGQYCQKRKNRLELCHLAENNPFRKS
jgi:MoaA/NifB/PqqE/SkfB family radical SAM enzyme